MKYVGLLPTFAVSGGRRREDAFSRKKEKKEFLQIINGSFLHIVHSGERNGGIHCAPKWSFLEVDAFGNIMDAAPFLKKWFNGTKRHWLFRVQMCMISCIGPKKYAIVWDDERKNRSFLSIFCGYIFASRMLTKGSRQEIRAFHR